jgi:hypothetical protein
MDMIACPTCGEPPDRLWSAVSECRRVTSVTPEGVYVRGEAHQSYEDDPRESEWWCANDHSWTCRGEVLDWVR